MLKGCLYWPIAPMDRERDPKTSTQNSLNCHYIPKNQCFKNLKITDIKKENDLPKFTFLKTKIEPQACLLGRHVVDFKKSR